MDSPSEPTDPDADEPTTPAAPELEPPSADAEAAEDGDETGPETKAPADEAAPEAPTTNADPDAPADPEPVTTESGQPEASKTQGIRIGALIAVALAAAFVVWLLVRNDDSAPSASTETVSTVATSPTTTTSGEATPPAATSEAELQGLAAGGATIYWAGPAENATTLTLVKAANGTYYVRYLPEAVDVTDPIPPSLVVATYPLEGALAAVKRAAKSPDSVSIAIANGGTAVYAKSKPTNVYFAYPKSSTQIEVYDPSPGRALQLVTSGTVTPVAP